MKKIQVLSHRHAAPSAHASDGAAELIDRALTMLAEGGLEFEPVERCPAPCRFCDSTLIEAA